MMTAEQFYSQRLTRGSINDFISYEVDSDEVREKIFAFSEAYAAAQLAEKERECKEQEVILSQRNFEISQLKGMFQKNFTWVDNGTCLELHNQRAEAAEERLKEAQAEIATWQSSAAERQRMCETLHADLATLRERLRQREAELGQRWIAVEEQMPEPGECLTYAQLPHSGDQYYDWIRILNYFAGKFHFYHTEDCEWIRTNVTHWQPLPSPPKAAKS